ncbi:unnamed protein product [Caenorhabditis nigoni]
MIEKKVNSVVEENIKSSVSSTTNHHLIKMTEKCVENLKKVRSEYKNDDETFDKLLLEIINTLEMTKKEIRVTDDANMVRRKVVDSVIDSVS